MAGKDQASVVPKQFGRIRGNFLRDVTEKGGGIHLLMKAAAQTQQILSHGELDPRVLLSEVAAI